MLLTLDDYNTMAALICIYCLHMDIWMYTSYATKYIRCQAAACHNRYIQEAYWSLL